LLSEITRRIKHLLYMTPQKTSQFRFVKSFITVLMVLFIGFQCNAEILETSTNDSTVINQKDGQTPVEKPAIQQPERNGIYNVVEKMPEYPGGEKALLNYIAHTIKYPVEAQEKGIQGRIVVRFVINKLGKVEKTEILRGLHSSIDKEGIRVVNTLPDWIPGEQKGEKVDVYFTLPITFKLKDDSRHLGDNQNKNVLPLPIDSIKVNEQKIYTVIEQMPQFPGGDNALINFVGRSIIYPMEAFENSEQGKVVVRFVVNTEGKVEKAQVIRSVSPSVDKEALRVINILPAFIPGKQNGKVVNVYYTLPITFRLEPNNSNYKYGNWADPKIGTRGKNTSQPKY